MSMFCNQCQEASKGTGCEVVGVCGKKEIVSNIQDLLIYTAKGVAICSEKINTPNSEVNKYITESLFTTITNANFSNADIIKRVKTGLKLRESLKKNFPKNTDCSDLHDAATWNANTDAEFEEKSATVGVLSTLDIDIRSLKELLTGGVKGMAAYLKHAMNLGFNDESIHAFTRKALIATTNNKLGADDLLALVLECGKVSVDAMALLDKANTTTYGNPEATSVNIGVSDKPGILISGHDLKDIEELLKQTENTGIDIYTHSEMLPSHYYPNLKKYKHLVGNYGNAWWKQKEEFESFNGPILMTTNCIVPPLKSYINRIFTTGETAVDGVAHIEEPTDGKPKDFSAIIELAKTCAPPIEIETGEIIGGFAHSQVLALGDKVVEAVKSGAIRKFFVMAGCDGRMKSREYYTDFAKKMPKDTVILTAGCAKYRYNKLELGDINGIPRVLDAGQCNDSYSLAIIALKLKEIFELEDINELPIAYNIAWYEQKAVTVLLALLHLGVKNIHLGPTLPAFLSPNVAKILIDTFGIAGITTVDEDMKIFMGEDMDSETTKVEAIA